MSISFTIKILNFELIENYKTVKIFSQDTFNFHGNILSNETTFRELIKFLSCCLVGKKIYKVNLQKLKLSFKDLLLIVSYSQFFESTDFNHSNQHPENLYNKKITRPKKEFFFKIHIITFLFPV